MGSLRLKYLYIVLILYVFMRVDKCVEHKLKDIMKSSQVEEIVRLSVQSILEDFSFCDPVSLNENFIKIENHSTFYKFLTMFYRNKVVILRLIIMQRKGKRAGQLTGSCISFFLRLIMTRRKGKWAGRGSLSLKYDRGCSSLNRM